MGALEFKVHVGSKKRGSHCNMFQTDLVRVLETARPSLYCKSLSRTAETQKSGHSCRALACMSKLLRQAIVNP